MCTVDAEPRLDPEDPDLTYILSQLGPEQRREALATAFDRNRPRLRVMVDLRLHPLLRGHIDPSDVLQEAFLEAARRLERYLARPALSLFLWMRRVTGYALREQQRPHLGAERRRAGREQPRGPALELEASTVSMAERFAAAVDTPSEAALREDRRAQVQAALETLPPDDREILALRFFEQLSSAEAARVLEIKEDTARKRYLRALGRFKKAYGPIDGLGL
jgi:RNA polymerase sigma-70 factor (ECF subfamily)